ncbi:MAG: RimK family alpha-L-glutamate ligase [Thermodesulfobacteriota bacterium]|nr:RimK family alpha-L-glutamate ligase [Thermodesulfobacteriota bacterium]
METPNSHYIALGSRLAGIPEVLTLGLRPNFLDYTQTERDLILSAGIILYPTLNYAQFFTTMGKSIFPSLETYLYADEKIKQTTLFYMLGIPHPRTRIYYRLHQQDILKEFAFPFIGKLPRRSAMGRGVFKLNNVRELEEYLKLAGTAYIQEYLPHDRDLRVVLINYKPVLAYWRVRRDGDFRTNLSQGGTISFDDVPLHGIKLARDAARKCRFNDVGMDLIKCRGKWHVIESNMKYGRKGLKMKGLDLKQVIRQKLVSGELFSQTYASD